MEKMRQTRIWKRTLAILLVLTIVVTLCGCVRYRAIGTVHDDGTISFYVLYATATILDDSSDDSLMSNQERQQLEKDGWKIQPYNGEPSDEYEYNGLVISKENIKLEKLHDEVSKVNFGEQSLEGLTCTKKGEVYTIEWDVKDIQNSASQSGIDAEGLLDYGGFMEFVVKLPCKPKSSNATKQSGGELTWDLYSMDEPIHLEFELETSDAVTKTSKNKTKGKTEDESSDGVPLWLALTIIGAVVVAAAVVVVAVILKYKKKENGGAPVPPTSNMQQMTPMNQGYTPQSQYMSSPYSQSPYAPQQNAQYMPPQNAQYMPPQNAKYMPPQNAPIQQNWNAGMGNSQTSGFPSVDSMRNVDPKGEENTPK